MTRYPGPIPTAKPYVPGQAPGHHPHQGPALPPGMRPGAWVNPTNGYREAVSRPGLWTLLFGFIYLAYKGAWMGAVVGLALAFVTGGLSWFVLPFFARSLVEKSYQQRGWVPVP